MVLESSGRKERVWSGNTKVVMGQSCVRGSAGDGEGRGKEGRLPVSRALDFLEAWGQQPSPWCICLDQQTRVFWVF